MEHEEEPNTTMARTMFEFAREAGFLNEFIEENTWDQLSSADQVLWQRMAAVGHEAYHKAYEAREQLMPATVGRHRGQLPPNDLQHRTADEIVP